MDLTERHFSLNKNEEKLTKSEGIEEGEKEGGEECGPY